MKVRKSEIMLYVKDVEMSRIFWIEKVGLVLIEKRTGPESSVAYAIDAGTSTFVLMDKALVELYSPEVNSGMPSIMFCVDDLDDSREQLIRHDVEVTEIFEMNGMRTFSFSDCEGNYYAVKKMAS